MAAAKAGYIVFAFEPIVQHIDLTITTFNKQNVSYHLFKPTFGANNSYDVTSLPTEADIAGALASLRQRSGRVGGFVLLFHAAVGQTTGSVQIFKGT